MSVFPQSPVCHHPLFSLISPFSILSSLPSPPLFSLSYALHYCTVDTALSCSLVVAQDHVTCLVRFHGLVAASGAERSSPLFSLDLLCPQASIMSVVSISYAYFGSPLPPALLRVPEWTPQQQAQGCPYRRTEVTTTLGLPAEASLLFQQAAPSLSPSLS